MNQTATLGPIDLNPKATARQAPGSPGPKARAGQPPHRPRKPDGITRRSVRRSGWAVDPAHGGIWYDTPRRTLGQTIGVSPATKYVRTANE